MSDKLKKLSKFKPYIVSCLIALTVGGISALATAGNMDIYSQINLPPFAPPTIVFPIGWTILYILMGISSAIIYTARNSPANDVRNSLITYCIQLIINGIWSIIFFSLNAYLLSFVWLLVMLAAIIIMINFFARISKNAAYLQIPYVLWVIFAGYLNLMIYILN